MIWLAWRHVRTAALVVAALPTAAAVYLLITGAQLRHAYNADLNADLIACRPQDSCSGCSARCRTSTTGRASSPSSW
jgi:hypothetical protein